MPYAGDHRVAKLTPVSHQIILGNKVAQAFDQKVFAVVAKGIVPFMIRNITKIHVTDSFLDSHLSEALQG